jgi:hypothetical protein
MQCYHSVAVTAAIALCSLLPVSESHAQAHTKGTPVPPFTLNLKPGDYVWHPEVSPDLINGHFAPVGRPSLIRQDSRTRRS